MNLQVTQSTQTNQVKSKPIDILSISNEFQSATNDVQFQDEIRVVFDAWGMA